VSFPFFYVKRLLKQFWLFDLLIKPNAPFCWSNWPTVWKAALHFVFLNQVSSFSFLLLKHAYILEDSSWRPLQHTSPIYHRRVETSPTHSHLWTNFPPPSDFSLNPSQYKTNISPTLSLVISYQLPLLCLS
jgi:hypothetical protein